MLPALLPLLQIAGRAVFHIAGVTYLIWALVSLFGCKLYVERRVLLPYLLMVIVFLASVLVAGTGLDGIHSWLDFVLYSCISLIVLASLPHVDGDGRIRLLTLIGIVGIAAIIILYLALPFQMSHPGFIPRTSMRADNLPLLTPFALYLLQYRWRHPWSQWIAAIFLVAVILYVIGSVTRTTLLSLSIALACYAVTVMRLRPRVAAVMAIMIIALAGLALGDKLIHSAQRYHSVTEFLDVASSGRTELWRQALQSPPANIWLGVGLGTLKRQTGNEVLQLQFGDQSGAVKHLHNFILDCWYETGLIGLGTLLLWLGTLGHAAIRRLRTSDEAMRARVAVFLSATAAILVDASLTHSYGSKQFTVYLFLFLVLAATETPRINSSMSRK